MAWPQFQKLTPQVEAWKQAQIAGVCDFIDKHSPADRGGQLTIDALDRAFASWLALSVTEISQVNEAINFVGVMFGEFLVQSLGFEWVIATDEHGSELAVLALPNQGNVLIYPANFVAKRWQRKEANFLVGAFESIDKQVENAKAAWTTGKYEEAGFRAP